MRCKSCNKNVSKLYHGLCTSCLSLLAKDKNDAVEDMMNAVKQDA
jgi:NMD protein affecting ribosome stability and mRNA decay